VTFLRPSLIRALRRAPLALILGLLSCASPYSHNVGFGGYTEVRLDASHYRVRYDGNGFTDKARVWYYWLHRCAALTKEQGFTYFTLESGKGAKEARLPRSGDPGGFHLASYRGPSVDRFRRRQGHLCRVGGHTTYLYTPGYRTNVTTWHSNAIVAMINDIPDNTIVLEVKSILEDLGPFVATGGQSPAMEPEELFRRASCTLDATLKPIRLRDHPNSSRLHPLLQPNVAPKV
jgi:hypothetical protein